MLQRTLLTLLLATCALSSGCATVRRELGLRPDFRQNRNQTRREVRRPN